MKTRGLKMVYDGWLALTLTLSPEERGQQANIPGVANVLPANPTLRFARRREANHPLREEGAGVKASVGLISLLLLSVAVVHAQSYSIDWFKIAGGGGTSTGAVFSVSGTIGQPDASGALTGGNYSVTGGFWSLIAVVPTPGAPLLTITRSGANVIVSWPSPSIGFALQQNTNLATTNWTSFPGPVGDDGTTKRATNSPPTGNKYFRLINP